MSLSFVSILLFTTMSLTAVHMAGGDYQLEILLNHYRNPNHILADGSCCDAPYLSIHCGHFNPCYNRFLFCVRPYGSSNINLSSSPCPNPGHNYTTGTINSDDKSFAGTSYIYQEGNYTVPNPLVFTGRTWPGAFQLLVIVDAWVIFQTKLVDIIVENWRLEVNSTYSEQVRLRGLYDSASLNASARVSCKNSFFGPNCSFICSPGSCNFEDPCTILNPCSNGGTCLNTNNGTESYYYKCLCGESYSGQNCTEIPSKSAPITPSNNFMVAGNDSITSQAGGRRGLLAGTITGGILTIVLLLLAIIFVVMCIWCKRRNSQSEEETRLTQESKPEYGGPLDNPSYLTHSELEEYRKLENPIYETHPGPGDDSRSFEPTYENVTAVQGRSSHRQGQDPRNGTKMPLPSQYSVITRRDSDVSTAHSDSDVEAEKREEEHPSVPVESQYSLVSHSRDGPDVTAARDETTKGRHQLPIESQYSVVTHDKSEVPTESGYSVITRSNLGYDINEASDSEDEGPTDESRKSLL